MKLNETSITPHGLGRCCIQTIKELAPQEDYSEAQVLRCAHHQSLLGKTPHSIILLAGV